MTNPLKLNDLLVLEEAESTQQVARELLNDPSRATPGGVLALHQTRGRGRFDRSWYSERGDSLTLSLLYPEYAGHPKPWLIGMAVAVAAAEAIHSRLHWPNDLVIHGLKVGGILSELVAVPGSSPVPVVGVGINLNQEEFPAEIADRATSVLLAHGHTSEAVEVAQRIGQCLENVPDPLDWEALKPAWSCFDETPGKRYRLANGQVAVAIQVGHDGQLMGAVDGETMAIQAADALFGSSFRT